MIAKYSGEKMTPKQAALWALKGLLEPAYYRVSDDKGHYADGLTEREKNLIEDQIRKLIERAERATGASLH
jgi:hypothetical protein